MRHYEHAHLLSNIEKLPLPNWGSMFPFWNPTGGFFRSVAPTRRKGTSLVVCCFLSIPRSGVPARRRVRGPRAPLARSTRAVAAQHLSAQFGRLSQSLVYAACNALAVHCHPRSEPTRRVECGAVCSARAPPRLYAEAPSTMAPVAGPPARSGCRAPHRARCATARRPRPTRSCVQ